ncbi:TRAP transporter small permease [Synergistaceae bacterium OttesenSCG-928-I11]|nr:TRAP transporter small permease [Synergistaceae bacterium OttesenSCG-928-I11]
MKKIIQNLDEYVLMAMLSASTLLIFFQVIMRYIFKDSLSWSEELARYMYVWQTWIASSYAVKMGRHLRITSMVDKAKGRTRVWFELLVIALWFGFSVFLCFKAAELCHMIFEQEQTSPAMNIPMWLAYMAVPTGTALMAARLVQQFAANLAKLKTAGQAE